MEELIQLVKDMKIKEDSDNKIIKRIQSEKDLTIKCIYARRYLAPQSTKMETIIKNDLKIEKAINNTSGDGSKNGYSYEIKYSGHAKKSKLNFVQIRPDHKIDYYILCCYNMYHNDELGKGYIFKILADDLYELIIKYGSYAHGTCKKLGKITAKNIKGRNCEYALRCNPNAKKGKDFKIWKELLKYEVSYDADYF